MDAWGRGGGDSQPAGQARVRVAKLLRKWQFARALLLSYARCSSTAQPQHMRV